MKAERKYKLYTKFKGIIKYEYSGRFLVKYECEILCYAYISSLI